MKNKTEIVTCRFLPEEKDRLFNVCKQTNVSVSSLARMAITEYLTMHSVDEEGSNVKTYKEPITNAYRQYMINDWSETNEMADHNETFLNKILRMKENLDAQIIRINKEKEYEHSRLLEKLERDSDEIF
jgi:hypothetical protein